MPLNHIDFLTSRLASQLTSTMQSVKLRDTYGTLDMLNALPIGDHIYLIVSYQNRREVLRYTHTHELVSVNGVIELSVGRGQHNTTITSWPTGSCVRTEFTVSIAKEMLSEWWEAKNCNCGDPV